LGITLTYLKYDRDKISKNEYNKELFARGYVFSSRNTVAPDNWVQGRFGNLYYAHDVRLTVVEKNLHNFKLIFMGVMNDVRDPFVDAQSLSEKLIDALVKSEEEFLELLSFTCGRYVIAWQHREETWITTDATGMKAAYYVKDGGPVIGSHVRLVAWNMIDPQDSPPIEMKFGYPGIRTPIKDVYSLTPNTKLNVFKRNVIRYWPTKKIQPLDLKAATSEAGDYLQGAFDHYASFFKPLVSVTAGLDSRVALAMSKGKSAIEHFTYYRNDTVDTDRLDKDFVDFFTKVSGREVDLIELRLFGKANEDFAEIQSINTIYNHIKKLAWIYYNKHNSRKEIIHVRSNISEVGREFYRGKNFPVKSGQDLARIYLYGDKQYTARYVFDVISRFTEFDAIAKTTACAEYVDVKSLFYWEFRMSSWHSGVVLESDPAFETVSIYNCRRTLQTLLSVKKEERLKSSILRNIIAEKWPELSEYDVNGKPFWM